MHQPNPDAKPGPDFKAMNALAVHKYVTTIVVTMVTTLGMCYPNNFEKTPSPLQGCWEFLLMS
eukprot:8367497-Pyramimonas_sp.AAC.1